MTTVHRVSGAELRFGDWGPGYLVQDDAAAFGVIRLRPGDEFPNHVHSHHTESFLVLEGGAELWLDRTERLELGVGDLVQCVPGVEHFFRNAGDTDFAAAFVKAPGVPGDKVDVEWRPAD